MNTIAIVEARMSSNRLPGKVLLEAAGKTMLEHLIDRLRAVPLISKILIATTTNQADDVIQQFAMKNKVTCYRGSEDDVMQRVIDAGESVAADVIVSITADCPIIDPKIVEQMIRMFFANNVDYISNGHIRSYPDGMDCRIFHLKTLKRSANMTFDKLDHEHVTLHIRNHPELFSHIYLLAPPDLHWPELGLTLDEISDYNFLKKIIEHFYSQKKYLFDCRDVIELMKNKKKMAHNQ